MNFDTWYIIMKIETFQYIVQVSYVFRIKGRQMSYAVGTNHDLNQNISYRTIWGAQSSRFLTLKINILWQTAGCLKPSDLIVDWKFGNKTIILNSIKAFPMV